MGSQDSSPWMRRQWIYTKSYLRTVVYKLEYNLGLCTQWTYKVHFHVVVYVQMEMKLQGVGCSQRWIFTLTHIQPVSKTLTATPEHILVMLMAEHKYLQFFIKQRTMLNIDALDEVSIQFQLICKIRAILFRFAQLMSSEVPWNNKMSRITWNSPSKWWFRVRFSRRRRRFFFKTETHPHRGS